MTFYLFILVVRAGIYNMLLDFVAMFMLSMSHSLYLSLLRIDVTFAIFNGLYLAQ